ncbi:S10 family serine carboxypeptidase-like protein [Caulobacter segnis]
MTRRQAWGLLAGLAAGLLATGPVAAQTVEPPNAVTRHVLKTGAAPLAYEAEAGRIPIKDVATGEPLGSLFYVAYRAPAPKGTVRPITFIWNGGPGAASASLNFEGFGPKRIEGGALVDNADTWLTDSDLVFMDAMGVGFSRAVSLQAQEAFTSIVGDIAATTEFIRAWLLRHGAEDRPLIVAGQSYGAGRAGASAYQLLKRGFDVRGVALISNTQGLPRYPEEELLADAMHVGDYAVAALYYKKLPPELGTTPVEARAKAEQWARDVYIPALRRRDALTADERTALIADLARRIGLTPKDIDEKTISLTQGHFLGTLVPGRLPYYLDYRKLTPYEKPSLAAGIRYTRRDLGYPTDLPYLGVEPLTDGFAPTGTYPPTVNEAWVHSNVYGATREQVAAAQAEFAKSGRIGMGSYGPRLPGAAEAMALSPRLKVLVAHGAYDPLGGCSMDAERGKRMASPYREAVSMRCYLAGHAIYRDAPARAQFAADMRAFARDAVKP